ncbi:MAG: hypothetical protein FP816_07935 [Desulfobacteraceae bacterium]|nr:hypothetical protein [Desulfobacteraceae bacterium]
MIVKTPVLTGRVRKVPASFSWIDHRLVSDGHMEGCSPEACALYLFLVCVGDEKGLSYYGDGSIMGKLSMDRQVLESARWELIRKGLIAWRKPIYQVLSLEPVATANPRGGVLSLGDILKNALEVSRD